MLSVRCNPEDEKIIKQYAASNNKTAKKMDKQSQRLVTGYLRKLEKWQNRGPKERRFPQT